jgi:peptidylprolyl isomerase
MTSDMKKIIYVLPILLLISSLSFSQKKDTVTTASGIKYVQLKAGNGPKPVDGSTVKVYYRAKFMNGKEFESNYGGKPFKFVIGKKEVIPGWEEGLKMMSKGEKAVFVIPAKMAYGKRGSKDDDDKYIVPPDTDLIFEIELVDFK